MDYLLDTHAFLWAVWQDPNLSANAQTHMLKPDTRLFVSLASLWEISIKVGNGKLDLGQPIEDYIPYQLARSGIELLHPTLKDVLNASHLPLHHRDPFDRLLISQSIVQGMPLISMDSQFDAYGVERVW